jgi:hypothetical protein
MEKRKNRTVPFSFRFVQRDASNAIAIEYLEVPPDIAALPDIQAYGNVHDLHQAMARERLTGNGEGLKGVGC